MLLLAFAIGLVFNIYSYAAFKMLLFRYPTKSLLEFKIGLKLKSADAYFEQVNTWIFVILFSL